MDYNLDSKRGDSDRVFLKLMELERQKLSYKKSRFSEKFSPNLDNQQLVSDQKPSEFPNELYYKERTVFKKRRLKNCTWTCDLEIESGTNIPSWVNVEITKSDKFD